MNKDLTTGNPNKVLRQFCIPLFASVIFQQLYNIADSFVAGRFIGENALAAVGNSYEITLIFIAFAFGCNMGCSVTVSRFFGGKRYSELKTAVYTTFISGGALCVLLMLVSGLLSSQLLQLINTPQNVFADSKLYLDIYILGLPFVFFYNISTGIFSALGDSKTPFYFLAVSSCVNILMDILFVAGFKMGVSGVAWATFICQGASCILAVLVVLKRLRGISTDRRAKIFSWRILKQLAVIAVPSIFQQGSISVGNIIIQGVINSFGSGVMAGYSASVKLNNLVITSFTTIGSGISNYTAQNLGAGKPDRVRSGFFAALKMVWVICIPFVLIYICLGKQLIGLFLTSPGEEALSSGIMFLRIVSPFYFLIAVKFISDASLRGGGYMIRFTASALTDLALRVILAAVLSRPFGVNGIWSAWPVGWIAGTVLSLIFLKSALFKNVKSE